VLLLVVAAVVGTWLYARSQYYVGVAKGTTPNVAVYRGVSGSVLGVDLSSLEQRTDLPVDALPADLQSNVRDTIEVSSKAAAARVVTQLRAAACPSPTPSPTPSTSKTSPAPSPAPTPTYCHD
jgi:protein phosphatase